MNSDVHITIVAVEKQEVVNIISVCGCILVLFNLACKLHLLCAILNCHLLPVWVYHIFPCYFVHATIF